MAGEARRPSVALKKELLGQPYSFSFFQILRLLTLLGSSEGNRAQHRAVPEDQIKVRPELSLGFPAADVAAIEPLSRDNEAYLVTATFLGLYGSSSPLPTFYTEDLLDEAAEDETVTRDFLDILNQHLYHLLYACWTKYRLYLKVVEEQDLTHIERLFCLLGLGDHKLRGQIPENHRLLRYLGLVTQHPHSALALKTMLRDALEGMPVEVLPCIPRMASIPEDQRCCLGVSGSTLGVDTFIGKEILDRSGKFRLQIGPLSKAQFRALLPDQEKHALLVFLTDFYVSGSLQYDMELILAPGQMTSIRLGDPESSRLGWNSWIFTGQFEQEARVVFAPQRGTN